MSISYGIFDSSWRWRLQGPGGNPWVFFYSLLIVAAALITSMTAIEVEASESRERTTWTNFRAYIPEKWDYSFQLGATEEQQTLYWMGAKIGRHLGRCMASNSQTCQQYFDATVGVAGRDGQTDGFYLAGLRWQFIDFPDPYSPHVTLLAGLIDYRDNTRNFEKFAYGVGYGWTASVHERIDLSLELKVGMADEVWSQAAVGVHLKMDQWLKYFGERLQELGGDAARMTGRAIRGTLKTTGEAMGEVIGKPIQKATEAADRLLSPDTKSVEEDKP